MKHRIAGDDGFTLAELTVVLALLGVVLAVIYAGMQVVYSGQAAADRQAWFAREIGAPLEQLDQLLSQNTLISAATTQTVTLLIDRPQQVGNSTRFDVLEEHEILQEEDPVTHKDKIFDNISSTDMFWNPTVPKANLSWAEDIGNRAEGVSLFAFKDTSGADVPYASVPASATQVVITIVSSHDGRLYRGTRTVMFRNK